MTEAADVVVIGAGVSGSATTLQLLRQGLRVVQVDLRNSTGHVFRAEKVEPDQAELLRQLGLFEIVAPTMTRIHAVDEAYFGRILRRIPLEQYGMRYHEFADALRGAVPQQSRRTDRVVAIRPDPDSPSVDLASGSSIHARLIVVAGGVDARLREALGCEEIDYGRSHSFAFGFDVERKDGRPFEFDSLTYFPERFEARLAYVTLFRIGTGMRVNLFCYREAREEWVRAFQADPDNELSRAVPRLSRITGDLKTTSKVQGAVVALYRVKDPVRPGVVLISDAHQSVCPTTGTGLSKAFNDALVLCRDFAPGWMASGSLPTSRLEALYQHAGKIAVDANSLSGALYRRQISLEISPRWRIQRAREFAHALVGGAWAAVRERLPAPVGSP